MTTHDQSSACYVIDENFNIVTYNRVGKEIYPMLEIGKKCHQCLMSLNEPCPGCPVAAGVRGPKTYFDPIRKIYETVDTVEVYLGKGITGYAMVLSTTGDREEISRQLPTTEEELVKLLNQDDFDKLTKGYSRQGFIRVVEDHLDKDPEGQYAIVVLDIQKFKSINDIFGFTGGDRLLEYMYDKIQNDFVQPIVTSRLQSDHFVSLVSRDNLKLENYEKFMEASWDYEDRVIPVHLCSGIYFIDDRSVEVAQMIDWAFMAKDYAQTQENMQYAIYDDSMRQAYASGAEIISTFKNGIEEKEFEIYYQPIVDVATNRIVSAEALIRWNHKKLGFLYPDQFIPVLEKNGMITKLDRYVVEEVYAFIAETLKQKVPPVTVAVNLSWQDFYQHVLMDEIIKRAQDESIPKGSVNFEVTETSLSALNQNCTYILEQLRQSGSKIYLDDFGTGVSSLGMINNYTFDMVKIDRSFVRQLETSEKSRGIVKSIIEMCHRMNVKLVAEGVETEEQIEFLRSEGCDYIQGYYYARPMSAKTFIGYLKNYEVIAQVNDPSDISLSTLQMKHALDADFYKKILDKLDYFIVVINPEDDSLLYLNELSRNIAKCAGSPYYGEKCYRYMMGLDEPCKHCPKKRMVNDAEETLVVDDGQNVFKTNVSMQYAGGRQVFVEIGKGLTDENDLKATYTEQIKAILAMLPDGQGVFHVDVIDDRWISSDGQAQNARDMQNMPNVDTLIQQIASFVPNEKGQKEFFDTFCRDAMLKAYKNDEHHITKDTLSYYDDKRIRMSRITAHLLRNPSNDHLECLIYGVDISKKSDTVEKRRIHEETKRAIELYQKADRDRRIDFLTKLKNRLELNAILKDPDTSQGINAVLMLDIDDFKRINDRYGHVIGDACLTKVGEVLNRFGTTYGYEFFRYGGEEFLGLAFTEPEHVGADVEGLLSSIRKLRVDGGNGEEISLTVSLGYTTERTAYERMIDTADRAMYVAKRMGKNRAVRYEDVNM